MPSRPSSAQYNQPGRDILSDETRPMGMAPFANVLTHQGPLPFYYIYQLEAAYEEFTRLPPITPAELQKYDRRAQCAYDLLNDVGKYVHLPIADRQAIRRLGELLFVVYLQRGLENAEYITEYLKRLG